MFLPIFPLELVVFPREKVPLHIFEPRYKQLIGECRDEGITFGIPPVVDGNLSEYGTEVELRQIFRTHPGGEMDILTAGLRVFRLDEYQAEVSGKLYSGAEVTAREIGTECGDALRQEVAERFRRLCAALNKDPSLEDPLPEGMSFLIGHRMGLDAPQKVRLLSMEGETERLTFLREHLERAVPAVTEAVQLKEWVGGNGHVKGFPK